MHDPSASLDQLHARLRRLHSSLASTSTFEIPVFQSPRLVDTGTLTVEFTDGRSLADLENVLATLIANIASLKDHLEVWCDTQAIARPGNALIKADLSVALIHDLWIRDKHGALDRPRSGHRPLVRQVHQSLMIEPINGPDTSVECRTDLLTGETRVYEGANTRLSIVIDGEIFDESGERLGNVLERCAEALNGWEVAMSNCGVPL